ncbi:alpha/beta fold hydrolase [Dactylosporangium sucinum]|uniref:Hydrolase n=1 Tax=Dactylosporangium sucinum TaxID=1424081 RepID=A0A917T2J4_9ACTN|nr:alpha/beta fold hydrolase [Dactylosporangium sucinum]GGM05976.1 hydrolase [Dactylosporangium sucinum]
MRLVLLHGIGSRRQLWRPVLPALEARFDVLAADLPGFGTAPPLGAAPQPGAAPPHGAASRPGAAPPLDDAPRPGAAPPFDDAPQPGTAQTLVDLPSPAGYLAALADWVEDLAGEPCHVAGSSMGGGVALELGRRGFARSVTAFSPIGFWGPLSRRWCQASVTAARVMARTLRPALPGLSATSAGRIALYGLFFGHPSRVDPAEGVADAAALAAAPGFAAARASFAHHRFADPGALPAIPVTIAWGTRDAILPAYQSRRAQRLLPSARHVRLAGCGHLPFADAPERCADLITTTTTA